MAGRVAGARQRPLLLMLWFIAWQQTPCGSLPDDDTLIAARLGLPLDEFQQVKPILLRRWSQANDGRLYHPVLTELVLDMIGRKTRETQRKAAYRQKQREARGGGLSHGTHAGQSGDGHGNATGVAQDSGGRDGTTTTTTTDVSLSLERDSADTHVSSNGKSKATLGVRELVGCPVLYTIGWVDDGTAKGMFKFDDAFISDKLKHGHSGGTVNIHAWLTLPSMEVIDVALATTIAVVQNIPEGYGGVFAQPADGLNGMAYKPMLVGPDFLRKTGLLMERGIFTLQS
jgi:hypothetical protein